MDRPEGVADCDVVHYQGLWVKKIRKMNSSLDKLCSEEALIHFEEYTEIWCSKVQPSIRKLIYPFLRHSLSKILIKLFK